MAFVTALADFDRLSPYGAATSLPAYLLGPSLTGRNGHHDRVAFCGFTTYLLLGSLLLFKHGCFSLFEAARASRALDPPTSSSLAEEMRRRSLLLSTAGARLPTLAACRQVMWAWLSFPIGVELPDDRTGFSHDQARVPEAAAGRGTSGASAPETVG
jgi:hypothetical protein